ncbi:MAG: transposase [Alphaproteobacteria bacterium]|jgi:transposase|nr:transposase [Alphaproteobacteria bacterium]
MSKPNTRPRYSPEVRERAVRMVLEHEGDYSSRWAAIESVAAKIGCVAQTLDQWIKQAERDSGGRAGLTTDERAKLKALERENRELRQANEILKKASAYFAQAELDRRWKP